MNIPDKDISFYVGSFQRGERQGFNYFFKGLYPALIYFAFRLTNDGQAAATVVDKAFIELWNRRGYFNYYQGIKFWLYCYVRNNCFNITPQQKVSHLIYPANDNILAEVFAELHATIEYLPNEYRSILEMLWIQGKMIDTIAEELHLTIDTVRVRQARGIHLLQERVRDI